MKIRTVIAIMLACGAAGFAQEHMADTLRNGILDEDSKQKPGAAIQQYQVVLAQFAEARQTAATALFRMAECYRKQGNRGAAIASYQRVLKDFADQTKLAEQSRTLLATTYNMALTGSAGAGNQSDKAKFDKLMDGQKEEVAKITAARARYRETIEREMALVQGQIDDPRYSPNSAQGKKEIEGLQLQIIHLQRDLAAFDAGMTTPTGK